MTRHFCDRCNESVATLGLLTKVVTERNGKVEVDICASCLYTFSIMWKCFFSDPQRKER